MTAQPTTAEPPRREPARTRAVFSTADFAVLKQALGEMIARTDIDDAQLMRMSALYHRLGRLD